MPSAKPLILILEDDEASAEALGMILCDWGAETAHAANADAVSGVIGGRLSEIRFVIADYNLGSGFDGVTIGRRLKQLAPQARILVLSGSFHGVALDAAVNAGFDVIQKPARADTLIAWLEKC